MQNRTCVLKKIITLPNLPYFALAEGCRYHQK